MIRTLIVDDSPLVREILKDFFESDSSFEIAGVGENGQDAIEKARILKPDLITMDIEMPVMNGLDAIEEIRKFSACGLVVITTVDTARMAYESTLKGAHEFFAKDIFTSSMTDEKRNHIFNTLKQIAEISKNNIHEKENKHDLSIPKKNIKAVVIASSTGGPMALCQLCSGLTADFPVPIILVQHNTSGFDKGFVQWLDGYSQLNVKLAEDGIIPESGNLYIAPTGRHLIITPNGFLLDDSDPLNNQKPAADLLFKSASSVYKDSLISIVLTGMGCDGAEGTRYIKEAGGITIAQDEASSMIYGMPEAAARTGCVDMVLPLSDIARKLITLAS